MSTTATAVGNKQWITGGNIIGTDAPRQPGSIMKNNKALGQHWLRNREILNQIADFAATPDVQLCLEIGPGLGTLTSSLLKRFARVVAVEFDARLAAQLPASFPGKNLKVIHADILEVDLAHLVANQKYVVAGNIPYYITSPIIHRLLTEIPQPEKIVLLIQKEVAARIAARQGEQTMLSLFVQNLATVTLGPVVSAVEFTPPPKVDSQVIILTPRPSPLVSDSALKLAQIGFSSPRKKLASNLAAGTRRPKAAWCALMSECHLSPDARPGDLSLSDWAALVAAEER